MNGYGRLAANAVTFLLQECQVRPGQLFVVGCSSSEVDGGLIGHKSNADIGLDIARCVLTELDNHGLYIAAQCCEHLNRALVMERETADRYGLEIVSVVPQVKAGGSFATGVYRSLKEPVVVERVQAHYGLDIGLTMIGMHMRPVAVPLRVHPDHIGNALVTGAYSRPKLIGGQRAQYETAGT